MYVLVLQGNISHLGDIMWKNIFNNALFIKSNMSPQLNHLREL